MYSLVTKTSFDRFQTSPFRKMVMKGQNFKGNIINLKASDYKEMLQKIVMRGRMSKNMKTFVEYMEKNNK